MPIEDVAKGPFRREIVYDVPFDEYAESPAMNASTIKAGISGKSVNLKRIKWAFEHGREDTEAMMFGRAQHCLMFEPDEFASRYCAYDGVRNAKYHAYQDFIADHPGAEILKLNGPYSYNKALEAAVTFCECKEVAPLTAAGKAEVTLFTEFMGMQLRARLDWISTLNVLVDMKTSRDVSEEAFGRQFFSLHYDVQLGMYQNMLADLTGRPWPVKCIAVENKEPFEVVVYDIPDAVLDQGWDRAKSALQKIRVAIDTGDWPGVSAGGCVPLFIPTWEMESTVEWSD